MSSSNLSRWSGLAALVGAVLVVVLDVVEFVLFGGQPESVAAATSAWIVVQVAGLVATVLTILALVGLYARQAERAGALGLIAFLVALAGEVMIAGDDYGAAFIGPWLAQTAPEVMDVEPSGVLVVGYLLNLLLLAVGWLLFGLASLRARVLPRGAVVLLMVGAVLLIVILMLELPGYSIVLAAALAWMGYALWSGKEVLHAT